jgi:hypothetical protein
MADNINDQTPQGFAVFAIRKSNSTSLIQIKLSFKRLIDEIVLPYESEEIFFIDGAPVRAAELDRIKIIRTTDFFESTFNQFHWEMRHHSNIKLREINATQYHVRLEALLRESGEDVTAQVINAYRTAIKPKLSDYVPNKEGLLNAAVQVFTESLKVLSGA